MVDSESVKGLFQSTFTLQHFPNFIHNIFKILCVFFILLFCVLANLAVLRSLYSPKKFYKFIDLMWWFYCKISEWLLQNAVSLCEVMHLTQGPYSKSSVTVYWLTGWLADWLSKKTEFQSTQTQSHPIGKLLISVGLLISSPVPSPRPCCFSFQIHFCFKTQPEMAKNV